MSDISNPNLDYDLHLIKKNLLKINRILSAFDLSTPIYNWSSHNVNPLINYKLDYNEAAE